MAPPRIGKANIQRKSEDNNGDVPKKRLHVGDPARRTVKIGSNYTTKMADTDVLIVNDPRANVTAAVLADDVGNNALQRRPRRSKPTAVKLGPRPAPKSPNWSTAAVASPLMLKPRNDAADIGIAPFPPPKNRVAGSNPEPVLPNDRHELNRPAANDNVRDTGDIRNLPYQQRLELLQGDSIQIFIGKEWVCRMPWRLFQFISTRADEILESNVLMLRLPAGLNRLPVLYILEWLGKMSVASQFFSIRRREHLDQDVAVCRIARLMGINKYTQHVFNFYWARFNNDVLEYDELSTIESMAATAERLGLREDDATAFFNCISRRLGTMVLEKTIPDAIGFSNYLNQHPKLKDAIATALEEVKGRTRREKKKKR